MDSKIIHSKFLIQGTTIEKMFKDWKFHLFKTEAEAKEFLRKCNVEHYWNLAQSQSVLEQEEQWEATLVFVLCEEHCGFTTQLRQEEIQSIWIVLDSKKPVDGMSVLCKMFTVNKILNWVLMFWYIKFSKVCTFWYIEF